MCECDSCEHEKSWTRLYYCSQYIFLIHDHIFHQQRLRMYHCECEWWSQWGDGANGRLSLSLHVWVWVVDVCTCPYAAIKTEHFCTMPFYRPIGSKVSYLCQPITNSNNSKAFHLYARQCANFASCLFRFCSPFLCHMRVFYSSFWCHPFIWSTANVMLWNAFQKWKTPTHKTHNIPNIWWKL